MMWERLTVISMVLAVIVGFSGCPSATRSRGIRVSDEEIYRKHCARCHDPYPTNHFSLAQWEVFLKKHPKQKKERAPKRDAIIIAEYIEAY